VNSAEAVTRARRAVANVLRRQGFVSAVDVLLEMGKLRKERLEDWRFGRVPHLESQIEANLHKIALILSEMRKTCRALGLDPRVTVYRKWGKRGRKIVLRFSKHGNPKVERAYSTHWVSQRFRKEAKAHARTTCAQAAPGPSASASQSPAGISTDSAA
jgi:hypothetical protein